MCSIEWLVDLKPSLLRFELQMRRREIYNSHAVAVATVHLIQEALEMSPGTATAVEQSIRVVCRQLKHHFPGNVIIVNVCETVIMRLKQEIQATPPAKGKDNAISRSTSRSFLDMMFVKSCLEDGYATSELKTRMEEVLGDLIGELSSSYDGIAKSAHNFLSSHDVVLTVGLSKSILKFLLSAGGNVTVMVPERAPVYDGVLMAEKLRTQGVKVVVIPDSAVFAVMPKVDRVIVSANAVLANGGIVSCALTHALALAAKRYVRPFIALYWQLKLTKTMPGPGKEFTSLMQPSNVMACDQSARSDLVVINPEGDYIPPELITLMINENGPHCPADVFSSVQANFYDDM